MEKYKTLNNEKKEVDTAYVICKNCGNKIAKEEKYCGKCGYSVTGKKELTKRQRSVITVILCIVVIGGLLGGIQIMVNQAWKASGEHGVAVAKEELSNNNKTSMYKKEIINKWNATLPLNNTNGLECAVYDTEMRGLYLKYNMGICVVDKNNEVNRYMEGDIEYALTQVKIDTAKEGQQDGYIYMKAEEFNKIIDN